MLFIFMAKQRKIILNENATKDCALENLGSQIKGDKKNTRLLNRKHKPQFGFPFTIKCFFSFCLIAWNGFQTFFVTFFIKTTKKKLKHILLLQPLMTRIAKYPYL